MVNTINITPAYGDIAICGKGHVGIITCHEPQRVTYSNGEDSMAWIGSHISPCAFMKWSSRNPIIIAQRQQDGTYKPVNNQT